MKFRINPRTERNQELILLQEYRETATPNHILGLRKDLKSHGSKAFMAILRTTKELHNTLRRIPLLFQLYHQARTGKLPITPKNKQMRA